MKVEWKSCFRVGVSIFLLYLCIQYWPSAIGLFQAAIGAASPLLIGCVIAYMLNILMNMYEKHYFPKAKNTILCKSRRPVCMIAAFLTLLAVIIMVIDLVLPQLASCVKSIFSALPNAIMALIDGLEKINILPEDIAATLSAIDWKSKIGQIVNILTSGVGNVMDVVISTLSSVFSGFVTALLSTIFSIYLLLGKDTLARQCKRLLQHYLKESYYEKFVYVITILHDCFRRYIVGQCTEAVILGVLCALGMFIIKLPYATMIGTLIAFTALIPVAGAYIGGGIGALMIFSVSPVKALIFVIYLVILQQLEGNLIYPRVVGSSLGLPAIWVLAAVTIGGGVMGVTGMLIGVPIAATLYRLIQNDMNKDANKEIPLPETEEDET